MFAACTRTEAGRPARSCARHGRTTHTTTTTTHYCAAVFAAVMKKIFCTAAVAGRALPRTLSGARSLWCRTDAPRERVRRVGHLCDPQNTTSTRTHRCAVTRTTASRARAGGRSTHVTRERVGGLLRARLGVHAHNVLRARRPAPPPPARVGALTSIKTTQWSHTHDGHHTHTLAHTRTLAHTHTHDNTHARRTSRTRDRRARPQRARRSPPAAARV